MGCLLKPLPNLWQISAIFPCLFMTWPNFRYPLCLFFYTSPVKECDHFLWATKQRSCHNRTSQSPGPREGDTSRKPATLGAGCKTLTQFMTEICDFPYSLFMTIPSLQCLCLCRTDWHSWSKQNLWRAFDDGHRQYEKVASSEKHPNSKPYPINDQNRYFVYDESGWKPYILGTYIPIWPI